MKPRAMNYVKPTRRRTGTILSLAALGLAALAPNVLDSYTRHVLMLAMINIILGLGLNFTLGYVGQPNFGQAALFGFGAYTSAILAMKMHVSFLVSIVAAGLVTLMAGYVLGYISLQLRGAYFCMVTIALGQALLLMASNLLRLTGGPMGLAGIPGPKLAGLLSSTYSLWLVALGLLALMLLVTRLLERSVMGRAWVAIRESETLARSTGVDTFHYALLAYVAGALFAGLGGSLYAHYVGFVDPSIFAFSWSSMSVVAVVIGGRGTIWGPVIGGLLVTLLPEYLRVAALWRLPMFGLVLILIITFMPDGLVALPRLLAQVRSRGKTGVALPGGGGD